jgi:hypothetical protein
MSVGYKPYVKSVLRMCRRKTGNILTETKTMTVKPGEGITPNVEIQYKICNRVVNLAASMKASRSGHTQMQQ